MLIAGSCLIEHAMPLVVLCELRVFCIRLTDKHHLQVGVQLSLESTQAVDELTSCRTGFKARLNIAWKIDHIFDF